MSDIYPKYSIPSGWTTDPDQAERVATLRRIVAAGMARIVVMRDDQLCSGGREPIPRGAQAATDTEGWVYCLQHIPDPEPADECDGTPEPGDIDPDNPYDQWAQTPGGWDGYTDELS